PRSLPADDPAAYVAATIATAPARYTARATVPEPAQTVRARTGALPQRIHPIDDGHCTVDLTADDPRHIAVQLLNLGPHAKLKGRPELAHPLAELGRQLLRAAETLGEWDRPETEQ
ncbi:WYL domain-containing protein, partial [Streptomyces sp. ERV7]|uniref:WYL domain-containing protein n=1 Tax=Streptomyces sp. ERV7 TaxID=1322334 RepID=UPI000AD91117